MNLKDYAVGALMEITARPDVVFVKGEGSWLWDQRDASTWTTSRGGR